MMKRFFIYNLLLWSTQLLLFGEAATSGPETLRLSMFTTDAHGEIRIGIEDTQSGQVYLLTEKQTQGRITFLEGDERSGLALIEKNGQQLWLSLTGVVRDEAVVVEDVPATEGVGVLTAKERLELAVSRRRALSRMRK